MEGRTVNDLTYYIAYGLGVDSTAMIVKLFNDGMVAPKAILFADTGAEKAETYAFLPLMNRWLADRGWPQVTVVRRVGVKVGDTSLTEELERLNVLPSLAFGMHSCSAKWKVDPQLRWLRNQPWAQEAWARGERITRMIGLDGGCADLKRTPRTLVHDDEQFISRFPLQEARIDREGCMELIASNGLPVPPKSSCFFCPAMKAHEILALPQDLKDRALKIEANALERLKREEPARIARGKKPSRTKGLGRSRSWASVILKALAAA